MCPTVSHAEVGERQHSMCSTEGVAYILRGFCLSSTSVLRTLRADNTGTVVQLMAGREEPGHSLLLLLVLL